MFAVIRTGGKQYRVAAADLIEVEKLAGEPGDSVAFGDVLVVGGESDVTLGSPLVAGATVAGEIVEQTRGAKILVFKKRRRKNSKRSHGHRQHLTVVRITEILTDGQEPEKRAREPAAGEAEGDQPKARAAKPKRASAKAEAPAAEAAGTAAAEDAAAPEKAKPARKSRAKAAPKSDAKE